jgi:magnesium chelatase family protein
LESLAVNGIEGFLVQIEVDLGGGLPSFEIVGLPDMAVKEVRDRVRAANKIFR